MGQVTTAATTIRGITVGTVLMFGLSMTGCGDQPEEQPSSPARPSSSPAPGSVTPVPSTWAATAPASSTPTPASTVPETDDEPGVAGTIVHFTAGDTLVVVTIREDTPTARDFLSTLPMTLPFEDYAGMEKIAYPERAFDYTDAEGMIPEIGDFFSYIPWGNFGFFYETGTLGFSEQLVRIGTTDDVEAVMELDGQDVTIAVAD